ncbi:complement C1q-like protein 3 [Biomphalaria pfeifferi]|uniref:Complement C1q-like protein 3 n=1 Tax=Biomphalaria pfeifferi TaxID=112525 RepID=A0AAD8EZI1_BIOPF|nr:complement C1q-like protein 3 [Biomphalaria pfeifferi]
MIMMSIQYIACLIISLALVQAVYSQDPPQLPRPAFSAGLTHGVNVSDHVNVTYDRVWTNIGNGYDPTTGVFTAPVDGTYTFLYHALAEFDGMLWLDFYQNSNYISSAYAHIENQYGATSNSVTLNAKKGDQMYITGHGTSILYGLSDDVYATFSGYLLFPSTTSTAAATTTAP